MGGLRIPPHLQDLSQRIAAKSWVKKKEFPSEEYFKSIDIFKKAISDVNGGEEPQNASIAQMVAMMINEHGSLLTYVLSAKVGIKDDAEWSSMCVAAAWVVIQEYNNAKNSGKWNS